MTDIVDSPDGLVTRFVRPGAHVHLAMTPGRPNAATYALARVFAGRRSLTVSTLAVHSAAHALALSGAVGTMITGFLGDTYPTPRPNVLYRDLPRDRPFRAEVWSLLSLLQRLQAGATGVPYAVTTSLHDSDLRHGKGTDLIEGPDPGVLLATALRPDITIVHGVCADSRGNVVVVPPFGEGAWSSYAAKEGVLATVERIVPDRVVDENPGLVLVPGQRVRAVCVAPHGAHPQSLRTNDVAGVPGYQDDYGFLADLAGRGGSVEAMREWYRTYVSTMDHRAYVDRVTGTPAPPPRPAIAEAGPSREERTIILGARAIADQVTGGCYDTLLAGIGASQMAVWLAAGQLRERGVEIQVCAEVGVYGQRPAPGDVYLFSQRHEAQQLSGMVEVLGGMVVGNAGRCLGVLAAGEVDPLGNVNTCLLPNGRWLTGTGGANDIASGTDCVVIASASPSRYVSSVCHVTSPGRNVREVVSQFGRFQRRDGHDKFLLRTWLPGEHGTEHDTPAEAVAANTRWPAPDGDCATEAAIEPAELAALRRLDLEGYYR